MSSFTFKGREYKMDDVVRESIDLAQTLAKNARLEQPLPTDTDLTESEQKEIQLQIHAMVAMPPIAVAEFWMAFAAHDLGKLASALRALSYSTQPHALSTLVQILSLLPDPKKEPYFRKFLRSPQSMGLPTLVTDSFVRGISWKHPSGPGKICSLIIHFLVWGDSSQGDDGKAAISATTRTELAKKLDLLMASEMFNQLPELQRLEMKRLGDILKAIEALPGDSYLRSTRERLEGQLERCGKKSCLVNAELTCSRCKSVRYCGKGHQAWHWKDGHKLRCFQTAY